MHSQSGLLSCLQDLYGTKKKTDGGYITLATRSLRLGTPPTLLLLAYHCRAGAAAVAALATLLLRQ